MKASIVERTLTLLVILLALATAGIHTYLFLIEGFLGNGKMAPVY